MEEIKVLDIPEALTPEEARQKGDAKRLFQLDNFDGAVEIMCNLLDNNPQLCRDPGVIGFITNCYHEKGNKGHREADEEALRYAEIYIQVGTDDLFSVLGIAIHSAYRLHRFDKVLIYAEQYIKLKEELEDIPILGMAATAAYETGDDELALHYCYKILDFDPNRIKTLKFVCDIYKNAKMRDLAEHYAKRLRETIGISK